MFYTYFCLTQDLSGWAMKSFRGSAGETRRRLYLTEDCFLKETFYLPLYLVLYLVHCTVFIIHVYL